MSFDAAAIKSRILTQLEAYCQYLLPNGKVKGAEFLCGSVSGEEGKSLSVALRGTKAGLWADYATSDDRGDVFDLWCKVKNVTFKEAFPDICKWCGVSNVERPKPRQKPAKPDTSEVHPMTGTKALEYLKNRGLSIETLKAYNIRSHRRPSPHNTDFVCFQFTDSEGDPVMLKSTGILPTKEGKKDIWTSPPYFTLWGWWTVKPSDREIIITEGEYDAMSVHQMNPGIPALSMPSGSSNLTWIENDFDTLQRFERIYICTDTDEPGEKAAQEIAKRLGLARCLRIKPPEPYKDANQFLTECTDDTADVLQWIAAAISYDPPTVRSSAAFRDDVKARLKKQKADEETQTFVFPDMPFKFRPGECTLLTGYTGHGKSEIMYQSLVHDMGSGEKVCIASMEIDAAEMIVNIGTQLIGYKPKEDEDVDRIMDWLDGRLWFVSPKDDARPTKDELFADFDYAVCRFACTRIAIDSLMFLTKKDDYEGQDDLAKACRQFCRVKHPQSHVILIAHSAIKQGEDKMPTASAIQGSTGILAPFNNILTVWRNVDKEAKLEKAEGDETKTAEIEKLHDGILKVWKQRATGKRPRLKLWFDPSSKRFRTKRDDTPPPTIETSKPIPEQTELSDNEPF